jgi:hypothetical protein
MMPYIGDRVEVRSLYGDSVKATGVVISHCGPIVVITRDDNPMSQGERYAVNTYAESLKVTR